MISEDKDSVRIRQIEGWTSSLDKVIPHNKGTTPKLKILEELTQVLSTFPLNDVLNDRIIASHPL